MKKIDLSNRISVKTARLAAVSIMDEERCCLPPANKSSRQRMPKKNPHRSGCMVCGAELVYFDTDQEYTCHYCGRSLPANARCTNGHFVCDDCHSADALEIIRWMCLHSRETDPVTLMQNIRAHPHFRIHGPEHHSLVPAVILTVLRNNGYAVSQEHVLSAIQRGNTVIGGACAFLGVCGAASGVGIAVALLLGSNPYDGGKRQVVQKVTCAVMEEIASYNAARCCQRDSWLALRAAAELLPEYAGVTMPVSRLACEQYSINKECIQERCPLWPSTG